MTATINVPEKYSEVSAGEKVYFETEIKWPENTERKDLRIEYTIKDKDNQMIAYLKVLKAIETQASFMDSISIPESTKAGTYTLFLNVTDYKELNQEVAASFNVVKKLGDSFNTYLFIILGVIGFIAIAIVIELFILIKKKSH
jgi:subtilase family serine protease